MLIIYFSLIIMTSPEIDPIIMGNTHAPLNSTTPNRTSTPTITTGAAQTISLNTNSTRSIELIPSVIPSSPIFIKYRTQAWQTAASATVFDEVLTEAKPSCQVGVAEFCTSFSIFSWASQTVYLIER